MFNISKSFLRDSRSVFADRTFLIQRQSYWLRWFPAAILTLREFLEKCLSLSLLSAAALRLIENMLSVTSCLGQKHWPHSL